MLYMSEIDELREILTMLVKQGNYLYSSLVEKKGLLEFAHEYRYSDYSLLDFTTLDEWYIYLQQRLGLNFDENSQEIRTLKMYFRYLTALDKIADANTVLCVKPSYENSIPQFDNVDKSMVIYSTTEDDYCEPVQITRRIVIINPVDNKVMVDCFTINHSGRIASGLSFYVTKGTIEANQYARLSNSREPMIHLIPYLDLLVAADSYSKNDKSNYTLREAVKVKFKMDFDLAEDKLSLDKCSKRSIFS